MRKGWKTSAWLMLTGIVLVGCNKEESPAPTATPPAQPQATAENPSAPAPASVSAAVTEEAQKLLDQSTQYIKDHKWELADQSLTKLEGMKAQLPAEWASKIDAARKALDTAKAAGGIQLPGGNAPSK